MVDFSSVISQINGATSLDEISQIVSQFSAKATGSGGILYSGTIGAVNAGAKPREMASWQA